MNKVIISEFYKKYLLESEYEDFIYNVKNDCLTLRDHRILAEYEIGADVNVYHSLEDNHELLPQLHNHNEREEKKEVEIEAPEGMKYLLKAIKTTVSSEKLFEIKKMLQDVKPSKSKWHNNLRIGQEKLYPQLEAVLSKLRNYTEHSIPFLKPVQKREAPNYYDIIKKPMDLQTVAKNLKAEQYDDKQSFMADLELIWTNCLLYNQMPDSIYRKHAMAMKKRADILMKKVADIKIKHLGEEMQWVPNEERDDDISSIATSAAVVKSETVQENISVFDEEEISEDDSASTKSSSEPYDFVKNDDFLVERYNEKTMQMTIPRLKLAVQESRIPFADRTAIDLVKGMGGTQPDFETLREYPELCPISVPHHSIPDLQFQNSIKEFLELEGEIPSPPLPSTSQYIESDHPESKLTTMIWNNIDLLSQVKFYHNKITTKNTDYGIRNIVPFIRTGGDLPPFKVDGITANSMLQQSLSTILSHAGFDITSTIAVNALADIWGQALQQTGRAIRLFLDKFGATMSDAEIVLHCLEVMGCDGADIDNYINIEVVRYGNKLKSTASKLKHAYNDFQRVTQNGDDEDAKEPDIIDDTFMRGGWFDETGIDFLNMNEIGLDIAVPDHLWQQTPRVSTARVKRSLLPLDPRDLVSNDQSFEKIAVEPWSPVIPSQQIGLLRTFYEALMVTNPGLIEDEAKPKSREAKQMLKYAITGSRKRILLAPKKKEPKKKKVKKEKTPKISGKDKKN